MYKRRSVFTMKIIYMYFDLISNKYRKQLAYNTYKLYKNDIIDGKINKISENIMVKII